MKYLLMMTLFMSVAYADVTCEGLCDQMEGTYSASAYETSKSVLKCLTATNPVAQMLYLLDPMTSSDAEMTCNLLQGNIC
jgi:hypothetical protein